MHHALRLHSRQALILNKSRRSLTRRRRSRISRKSKEDELRIQFMAKREQAKKEHEKAIRLSNSRNATHPVIIGDSESEDMGQEYMDTE
jgi:hypothetical protein